MATFANFIKLADKLIRKNGSALVLTRKTDGSLDPVTQVASTSTAEHTFRGVGFPPGRSAEFRIGSLQNRNIQEFYIAAKDQTVTPAPGDTFTYGGAIWTVIWAQTYDPAADGAIFTLAYAER